MKTKYVTSEKFTNLSKGKKVVDYPNPWFKDVNGIRYHIINPEMKYKIELLPKDSYLWYLGMSFESYTKHLKEVMNDEDPRVFVLSCEWFPTELVAGVVNGRFCNTSSLSLKTGWIRTMNSDYFRASKVKEAIRILNANGFMFESKIIDEYGN